jgi:hypothetical protein
MSYLTRRDPAGVLASLFGRRRVLTAGCATLSLGEPWARGRAHPSRLQFLLHHSQTEGFYYFWMKLQELPSP